jgi:AcrR family transcriptional regulator
MSVIEERRREEKEQRREQIVDAAEIVFADGGFARATLADVAKQARLSRGLIYFYFADKDDLYAAVTLRAMDSLVECFQRAIVGRATGIDRVEAIGRAYLRFSETDPEAFQALRFNEAHEATLDHAQRPNRAACLEQGCRGQEFVASIVRGGVADGSIRSDIGDPRAVALALSAFVHGLTQLSACKGPIMESVHGVTEDQVVEEAFALLRRSLAARR